MDAPDAAVELRIQLTGRPARICHVRGTRTSELLHLSRSTGSASRSSTVRKEWAGGRTAREEACVCLRRRPALPLRPRLQSVRRAQPLTRHHVVRPFARKVAESLDEPLDRGAILPPQRLRRRRRCGGVGGVAVAAPHRARGTVQPPHPIRVRRQHQPCVRPGLGAASYLHRGVAAGRSRVVHDGPAATLHWPTCADADTSQPGQQAPARSEAGLAWGADRSRCGARPRESLGGHAPARPARSASHRTSLADAASGGRGRACVAMRGRRG